MVFTSAAQHPKVLVSQGYRGCWINTALFWSMDPHIVGYDTSARRDRPVAVGLICKSLTAQTGTQSVERWLGEVRLAELKHRARALAENTLESCVKLNVQDFQGRLAGKAFNAGEASSLCLMPL